MLDMDASDPESCARAAVQLLGEKHMEPQEVVIRKKSVHGCYIVASPVPSFDELNFTKERSLVAGGAGGLGQQLAKFLVEKGSAVTVLGRTAERTFEVQAEYRKVDISQAAEVERVVKDVDPTCVFQLAGVLKDARLEDLTWATFEEVLKPKVYGAQNLHRFAKEAKAFVLFSSMASILPFPGQMNHAAANAFTDALAHERRSAGLAGLAINWGLWKEVGAAAATNALAAGSRQGMKAMTNLEAGP